MCCSTLGTHEVLINVKSLRGGRKEFVRMWMCANCQTESSTLSRCSRCDNVHYCNTECQQAHWEQHKIKCKEVAELKKMFEPIVDGAYQSWKKHNNSALSHFARVLGGADVGKNLVIAILLEYKNENPIESRFQIVRYEKLPFDHPVAQRVTSEAADHNPLTKDKIVANFAVTCPDFGIGNGFRATGIMHSGDGAILLPSDSNTSESLKSAERIVQAINEGILGCSRKEQRLNDAIFPWGNTTKYPSPPEVSTDDPTNQPTNQPISDKHTLL